MRSRSGYSPKGESPRGGTPLYNDVAFNTQCPTGWTTCTYFLLFGKCHSVTWPPHPSVVEDVFSFGDDLHQALVSVQFMPWWERGFARDGMQNLGKVKMKLVAWEKLPAHCFQTSLRLGDSVPSVKSQIKQRDNAQSWAAGAKSKYRRRGK